VSSFDGTIDWNAVAASGTRFGYAMVSFGTNPDVTFDQNYSGMKAAGMARGAVQFFQPNQDPAAQANLLIQKIGTLGPGDLPPALDVEVPAGQASYTIVANVQTWMTMVQNATGRTPILRTGVSFWNGYMQGTSAFVGNPLWVALWGVTCPAVPYPWQTWAFWMSADNGSVPGIAYGVDIDVFNGSQADLDKLTAGPFATFTATAEIRNQGFELLGSFSLGAANHAINPLTETVSIQVANFSATIPTASFRETKWGLFVYEGVLNGVSLRAVILPAAPGRFWYAVESTGASMTGTTYPVAVTLTIGNQRGTATAAR
jgi:lysozyme